MPAWAKRVGLKESGRAHASPACVGVQHGRPTIRRGEQDVLSSIDQRPNLMDLTPGEFEALITNLFEKMGLANRLTQASRDGGVDCVAYDPRPIFGGKVVIQAKRYKNTVGVSAVRDLFGTMQNRAQVRASLSRRAGTARHPSNSQMASRSSCLPEAICSICSSTMLGLPRRSNRRRIGPTRSTTQSANRRLCPSTSRSWMDGDPRASGAPSGRASARLAGRAAGAPGPDPARALSGRGQRLGEVAGVGLHQAGHRDAESAGALLKPFGVDDRDADHVAMLV